MVSTSGGASAAKIAKIARSHTGVNQKIVDDITANLMSDMLTATRIEINEFRQKNDIETSLEEFITNETERLNDFAVGQYNESIKASSHGSDHRSDTPDFSAEIGRRLRLLDVQTSPESSEEERRQEAIIGDLVSGFETFLNANKDFGAWLSTHKITVRELATEEARLTTEPLSAEKIKQDKLVSLMSRGEAIIISAGSTTQMNAINSLIAKKSPELQKVAGQKVDLSRAVLEAVIERQRILAAAGVPANAVKNTEVQSASPPAVAAAVADVTSSKTDMANMAKTHSGAVDPSASASASAGG